MDNRIRCVFWTANNLPGIMESRGELLSLCFLHELRRKNTNDFNLSCGTLIGSVPCGQKGDRTGQRTLTSFCSYAILFKRNDKRDGGNGKKLPSFFFIRVGCASLYTKGQILSIK